MLKSQERPFSFYGKALAKEEAAKQYRPPTAKDLQKPFKANPIPKSSLEVALNPLANSSHCIRVNMHCGCGEKGIDMARQVPRQSPQNHSGISSGSCETYDSLDLDMTQLTICLSRWSCHGKSLSFRSKLALSDCVVQSNAWFTQMQIVCANTDLMMFGQCIASISKLCAFTNYTYVAGEAG